jgi:hypothetical protein
MAFALFASLRLCIEICFLETALEISGRHRPIIQRWYQAVRAWKALLQIQGLPSSSLARANTA